MRIVSIGDLVTDFYYNNGKLVGACGGMTSHNIIANISKFKMETTTYGVCGNDSAGEISINSLDDIGVDVSKVKKLDDVRTRCFHVSYTEECNKLTFKSKKRCPFCNKKRWYEESLIDTDFILQDIREDDLLVFDNLNNRNQVIIDGCNNKKVIDLGQYFELENYTDDDIIFKIKGKFDIINLNERVEKYLENRFKLNNLIDIYRLLMPRLLIVTRGKKGTDFVLNNKLINKNLEKPSTEIDPTGAGDAFFSVYISEYVKNKYVLNEEFIDYTFEKATALTKKVVKKFGARGHISKLYKIESEKEFCSCDKFNVKKRKQIKRCNLNINNLEIRVINAVNSSAFEKLNKVEFYNLSNCLFVGTGGSYAGANFASKVINDLYGINTISILPRDVYYRNNNLVDKVFLFSYSGTTNDLIVGTESIDDEKKFIITKGETSKITNKINVNKNNIISYRTNSNKGKEKGFLAFEGALAPASLFLRLYLDNNTIDEDTNSFIKNTLEYWKNYFEEYFSDNKEKIQRMFKKGNIINIFTGDYSSSASIDLESKIIESGIFNVLIHEKKNFSHGRFINFEHLSDRNNIYFRQKSISDYEIKLQEYLDCSNNIIIESRYDGILCEFDLLVASQYLIYYVSNYLNVDMSKPSYSEDAMKIYFYKGSL